MDLQPLDMDKTIQEFGNKTIAKTKYANIRIIGEKDERQISWKTYQYIKNLPEGFTGSIEIKELGLTIPVKQIVKMEEKEGVVIEHKHYTTLPTDTIFLDTDFNILNDTRINIERKYEKYYIATCHYINVDGEKQYYVQRDQIKDLVLLEKDTDQDYPHYVAERYHYGIEK